MLDQDVFDSTLPKTKIIFPIKDHQVKIFALYRQKLEPIDLVPIVVKYTQSNKITSTTPQHTKTNMVQLISSLNTQETQTNIHYK